MTAQKGYYSLIQFSPDASRLEAVNVGVLLFCPAARFIAARTARDSRRPGQLVGRRELDRGSLRSAKRAIERRLAVDAKAFQTLEDLQRFVDTRANVLKLTAPRPIKVFDPAAELDKLFAELVGGHARVRREEPMVPELDTLFRRLEQEGRARLAWDVPDPIVGRNLHVPYAFQNGVWNLVKPHRFSAQEGPAITAAMRLAIEGDLLQRHGNGEDGERKLIVVASFDAPRGAAEMGARVEEVLSEYHVQAVQQGAVGIFAAHVEETAH